jgi:hypothetical protein
MTAALTATLTSQSILINSLKLRAPGACIELLLNQSRPVGDKQLSGPMRGHMIWMRVPHVQ